MEQGSVIILGAMRVCVCIGQHIAPESTLDRVVMRTNISRVVHR